MQAKNIYTYDDLIERLAECAIGTETMKQIETFIEAKKNQDAWKSKRLEEACRIIGSNVLDECCLYD